MTPEVRKNLFEIATVKAEELHYDYVPEGLWVTEDDLPSDASEFTQSEYEAVLSPERVHALEELTEAELKALREHRLKRTLLGDFVDPDAITGYYLADVADGDGNSGIALILCKGSSIFGLNIWVNGIFDTREAAEAHMEKNGWISQP
jgi:hypothetical protein